MAGFIEKIKDSLSRDISAWTLLISNAIVIYLAVTQSWSLLTILFAYWCQSIIIGFFGILRFLSLKKFAAGKSQESGKPKPPATVLKIFLALFFTVHYGFFHLMYLLFMGLVNVDWNYALAFVPLFFVNHAISFAVNYKKDSEIEPSEMGNVINAPYMRIIPMHITLLFAGFFASSTPLLVFFLALKGVVDLAMHAQQHEN
ncbi:MAG: DUF6498-containing protein [Candidatus Diapherotrites archaeon]